MSTTVALVPNPPGTLAGPATPAPAAADPARRGAKAGSKSRSGAKSGARSAAKRPPAVSPIPRFALIVGAMKSGTTTLYDYLVTHPAIAGCARKEPNFFSSRNGRGGPKRYAEGWADFDPARHRYALEASVDYTKHPRHPMVARRIAAFPAEFKFIYIMRDPIDRIESHIAHNIAKGRVTARDYAAMMEGAISTSRYGYQLDTFRAPLGNPEMLLLDFEDLKREPLALLDRVTDFLGLERFAFEHRPPSNTRRASSADFRLPRAERAALHAALAGDMADFARDYGFDVAHWGFGAGPGGR